MALVLRAYMGLPGRLTYWQVWRHSDMARLASAYHDDTITLPAVRGNIVDRNGALLVTNTPVFSIFASPDQISAKQRGEIAAKRRSPAQASPLRRAPARRDPGEAGHDPKVRLPGATRSRFRRPAAGRT